MRRTISITCIPALVLLTFLYLSLGTGHATMVTFSFNGEVNSVYRTSPGFPSALSNLKTGDPVSCILSVEVPSGSSTNYFNISPWNSATFYGPLSYSLAVNVNGVPFSLPSGANDRLTAFVWDGDYNGYDGFLVTNVGSSPIFQLGTQNSLASSTFSDESFPTSTVSGPLSFQMVQDYSSLMWFGASGNSLTLVQTPVPIPAAAWLLGSGLIGLVEIRRRMKK